MERNLKAKGLEKAGNTEAAIKLYEQNISENFKGNFPYDRLVVIYKKRKESKNVIRVLENAVYVFENIIDPIRADRLQKLNKFKKQLEKAQE